MIIGGVGGVTLAAAAANGFRGRPGAGYAIAIAIGLTVALAVWLGGRRATAMRIASQSGINLEAVRGTAPRVWLVAHVDSKSQLISTAVRTLGVVLLAASAHGLVVSLVAPTSAGWIAAGVFAAVGGLILVLAQVGANSDGAADNASGVVTVLEAAKLVSPTTSFGVLITDAEELALAGARAWVGDRTPGIALNCDTVDDEGRMVVMRYGGAADLADRARELARGEDPAVITIRPIPGVLTDSVAFRDAGWRTVTLSRGTIRTLNRIHTRRDSLDSLRGSGIPAAARVLARLVEELA
jgi:hypothetical protein